MAPARRAFGRPRAPGEVALALVFGLGMLVGVIDGRAVARFPPNHRDHQVLITVAYVAGRAAAATSASWSWSPRATPFAVVLLLAGRTLPTAWMPTA